MNHTFRSSKLDTVERINLKCSSDELASTIQPLYNKFKDRLKALKVLEVDVWLDGGAVGLSDSLSFCERLHIPSKGIPLIATISVFWSRMRSGINRWL